MTPCLQCKNFLKQPGAPACRAFPDGIPLDIWAGQRQHAQPVEGDGGVVFEHVDDDGSGDITKMVVDMGQG